MSRRSSSSLFGNPAKKTSTSEIIDLTIKAKNLPKEILALVDGLVEDKEAKQDVKESLALISQENFDSAMQELCIRDMTPWMMPNQNARELAIKMVSALQALEEAREANSPKSNSSSSGVSPSPHDSDDDALLDYDPDLALHL